MKLPPLQTGAELEVRIPDALRGMRLTEQRRVGRLWIGTEAGKMPSTQLEGNVLAALKDKHVAERVLDKLSVEEKKVLAVYRRYGGAVDGAAMRVDLLSRELIAIERRGKQEWYYTNWKRNPIGGLQERLVLLSPEQVEKAYYSSYSSGQETDRPLPTLALHPLLAPHIEPAGPPSWSVTPLKHAPHALGARTPASVVLDLSALFSAITSRGGVALTKSGDLPTPALRSLIKTVPLPEDPDYPLPDPHGLLFEILLGSGFLDEQDGRAQPDEAEATEFFAASAPLQAHRWTWAWLNTAAWKDGVGLTRNSSRSYYGADSFRNDRQVIAWALGCLARSGEDWYDLRTFVETLLAFSRDKPGYGFAWHESAWDPGWPEIREWEKNRGQVSEKHNWMAHDGRGWANLLMVTLPALGLVERGRSGSSGKPDCFRLTALGRAVFGAPETPLPSEETAPFLVVQPNFDVIAYLDRAGGQGAGLLGRIAERGSGGGGPVQTFRLTRNSVYLALESGLTWEILLGFLQHSNQGPVPPNVLRTLAEWSARREALVVRQGVNLLAFPTVKERDAWVAEHSGTPCGEHYVLGPRRLDSNLKRSALVVDHHKPGRKTLQANEYGLVLAEGPLDLVQFARLTRVAELEKDSAGDRWRLTAASVGRSGLKQTQMESWLEDHLSSPLPPLLACALDAWAGRPHPIETGEAVLLHVPESDCFEALVTSPRLSGFLLGSPGPGWLVVRSDKRRELEALLTDLGFSVSRGLLDMTRDRTFRSAE
jgi:hypothetical protein